MYCLGCRYNLAGVHGACPECGRRFDPRDSATFAASPRRRLGALTKRQIIVLVGLVGFVLLIAFGPFPYASFAELDLNSGRERWVYRVFGVPVFMHEANTEFAEFARQHLTPAGPPAWITAHRKTPFDSARVNWRGGRYSADLRSLVRSFEIYDVPLEARIEFANAALALARRGGWINPVPNDADTGFRLEDEHGRVLMEWSRP